jgi:hypothetical protein
MIRNMRGMNVAVLATSDRVQAGRGTNSPDRTAGLRSRERYEPGALGQVLRDPPGVAARIGEGDRAHAPVTIRRAADQCHSVLVHFSGHRIHVLNDDGELPGALLSQAPKVGRADWTTNEYADRRISIRMANFLYSAFRASPRPALTGEGGDWEPGSLRFCPISAGHGVTF